MNVKLKRLKIVETKKFFFLLPQCFIFEICMSWQAPQQEDKLELKYATFSIWSEFKAIKTWHNVSAPI